MEKEAYGKIAWEAIQKNFSHLQGTYLDHAGSTLYSKSQMETTFLQLSSNTFGNPHSRSPSSKLTSDLIDQIRAEVLHFFKADPNEYTLIFTSGATDSLKLVAESFTFSNTSTNNYVDGSSFVYLKESHTSVVGMREVIKVLEIPCYALPSDTLLEDETMISHCVDSDYGSNESSRENSNFFEIKSSENPHHCNSLFVFPALCNFSGKKYPMQWISSSQSGKLSPHLKSEFCVNFQNRDNDGMKSNWYCLLDAASYVATNPLDLSKWHPDFVVLSFYKMIGFPTGLGALIVHSRALNTLKKTFFGGGTVEMLSPSRDYHVLRNSFHERFEDGTSNFLAIISLGTGLREFKKLVLSVENVSTHTFHLAHFLHNSLRELKHSNGKNAIELYPNKFSDKECQSGIVTFNVKGANGDYIGYAQVEKILALHDIHVRTGCFCNPAACQRYLHLSEDDVYNQFKAGHKCGDENDLINGRPTGAVRVSFGYMSRKSDADNLIEILSMSFLSDHHPSKVIPMENGSLEEISLTDVKLVSIHVYPVKSCGSFSPKNWFISKAGLLYDRQWVVVNSVGAALTQKREPKLCLIRPEIDLIKNVMVLHCHGKEESISIPLNDDRCLPRKSDHESSFSKICGKLARTIDCGPSVGKWLSEVLDQPELKLMRYENLDNDSSLANDSPFLLVNRNSALDLQRQTFNPEMKTEIDFLSRFRGNLIIDGLKSFEEDSIEFIEIGPATFTNVGPCYRCQMICVDQSTAGRNQEALAILINNRGKKMPFGIHMQLSSAINEEIPIHTNSMIKIHNKIM